ncbi:MULTISPECIES: hypothetical protein [unclassified Pseudonocardia]|uniref:hypothetical protein n=1 Tax=unclassified Pseudonocardia TaxID=2619320 RepID=UPI0009641B75|nr:hypothetical protein [Pseudonocardia sp. Ae707_Ps1]OLM16783.1 Enoyl-CoA hydratase [Pseudonocardia sp. Ae707_Ps1]
MQIPAGIVGNEFAEVEVRDGDGRPVGDAAVEVRIDQAGNSPRLRVEDLESGRVRFFDALELETLVWLPEGHLRSLLDPSADRWREDS